MKHLLKAPKKKASRDQERLWPSIALAFVVLLAAWMGNANGGYFVGGWAPPALLLAVLALLVSVIAPFGGVKLRWSILALGLFAAYTAWTLASLLWSPNKGNAWLGTGQTFLYLLTFLVVAAFVALGASRRWVLAASVIGPAIISTFTLQALGTRSGELFEHNRLAGTVGYYNGEAAFLLVSFWIAMYLGSSRHVNPVLRGVVLAGAVISTDLAILTQSRGAMVAMSVSLLIFFLLSGQRLRGLLAFVPIVVTTFVAFPGLNDVYLALLHTGDGGAALHRVLPIVWLTAAGVGLYGFCWGLVDLRWTPQTNIVRITGAIVLVGCLIAFTVGATVLVEHVGNPAVVAQQKWEAFKTNDTAGQGQSRFLSASGSGRYILWQVAWKDFSAHPILGVGTQNYEATFYQLREPPATWHVKQPHMLSLEILSERGIVGGALFFSFLATCLVAGLWERFRSLRSEGRAQVGALVAAIAYWFVHSNAEWFWQLPAVTLPAIVYLALLVSPWHAEESTPDLLKWPLRMGGIGISVLAVLIVSPLYVSDRYLAQSYTTADPRKALAMVAHAQQYNPLDPQLPQRIATLSMRMGNSRRAQGAYLREIRLNPEHYAPYALLARFYQKSGQFEKASIYYRKALALNPLDKGLNRLQNKRSH